MVYRNVLVASITGYVLLGVDFLQDEVDGPVDIFFSYFLLYNTTSNTRKVHAVDHCIVQEMSEIGIDVCVERTELYGAADVLIEHPEKTSELRSLVIASCIVNLTDNATVKIRVMNPNVDRISMKQDIFMGLAQRFIQRELK